MTSRERVRMAINHKQPDRTPVDLGGCVTTGIQAQVLTKLRRALGLEERLVKVYEPMMFLGIVEDDIREKCKGDVVGLHSPTTLLGYRNDKWKPWTTPDGTEVLIGDRFQFTTDKEGNIYAYPNGNTSARPSALMPKTGFYFDNIVRQDDLEEHEFNAKSDYADQYSVFSEEDCAYYQRNANDLYENTDCSIFGNFFLGGVGDIFHIPAAWIENPKGIRDLEEWMMAPYLHPEYVKEFFCMQMETTLKNLELYKQAVGDKIDVIAISGTDFGGQSGLLLSPDCYREFYQPYHKIFNDWVHKNTNWKVFFHSCGSMVHLLDDLIDAGVDILNPVQISAAGMQPEFLKEKYGEKLVFWGGGVDPQKTMAFGTPEEVRRETTENVKIFSKGGGFVCANVHNIQANTPVENIIAFFDAIHA